MISFLAMRRIMEHNAGLATKMQQAGFSFSLKKDYEHWIDKDGNYVPYPAGTIRIGHEDCFMVRLRGDSWATLPRRDDADAKRALDLARGEVEE